MSGIEEQYGEEKHVEEDELDEFLDASNVLPVKHCYDTCKLLDEDSLKLIGCDGKNCITEWFHIECVGLGPSDIPGAEEKWFCPECSGAKPKKTEPSKMKELTQKKPSRVKMVDGPKESVSDKLSLAAYLPHQQLQTAPVAEKPVLTQQRNQPKELNAAAAQSLQRKEEELARIQQRQKDIEIEIATAKLAQSEAELESVKRSRGAAATNGGNTAPSLTRPAASLVTDDKNESALRDLLQLFALNKDSEPDLGSEIGSDGKISWRHKSGMYKKSSCDVKVDQKWPHLNLKHEYRTKSMAFMELSMPQFVAGEIEIISGCTDDKERASRLDILCSMMYNAARGYDFEPVLKCYAAYVREIEMGNKKWGHDFSVISDNILKGLPLGDGSENPSTKGQGGKKARNKWFCSDYNSGHCSKEAPHSQKVRGLWKQVIHICAKCYLKNKSEKDHPESSSECPYYSEDK